VVSLCHNSDFVLVGAVGKYGPAPVLVHDHNYVATEVDTDHAWVDHSGSEPDNVDSEFEFEEVGLGNY